MSILQYFSKNFFSRFFPDRYFQKTTDTSSVNVSINGILITSHVGNITVSTSTPQPSPTQPTLGERHPAKKYKRIDVYIKGIEVNSYINIPCIEIYKEIKENEEELKQLLYILFELFDDTTKVKIKEDEEEALAIMLENLL